MCSVLYKVPLSLDLLSDEWSLMQREALTCQAPALSLQLSDCTSIQAFRWKAGGSEWTFESPSRTTSSLPWWQMELLVSSFTDPCEGMAWLCGQYPAQLCRV